MKNLIILLTLVLGLISCSSDREADPPVKTPEEIALEILTNNSLAVYVLDASGVVLRNSINETQFYEGLELSIQASTNSKSYAIKNGGFLFESNGTWEFIGNNFDKIMLSGNKPASNTEVAFTISGDNLVLKFSAANASGGRISKISAVSGNYEIRLKKLN